MKKITFFSIIVALALIQGSFLNSFSLFSAKPDLLLVAALAGCFIFGFWEAIFFGLFAGFLKDIFSVHPLGIFMLSFGVWCFLLRLLLREVDLADERVRVALVFAVALLQDILLRIILAGAAIHPSLGITLRLLLFSPAFTALSGLLLFRVLLHENKNN